MKDTARTAETKARRTLLVALVCLSRELGIEPVSLRRALARAGVPAMRLTPARNSKLYYSRMLVEAWLKSLTPTETEAAEVGGLPPRPSL